MITSFLRIFYPSRPPNHPSRPPLKGRSPLLALNRNDSLTPDPSPFGERPGGGGILHCAYFVVGHNVCFTLCLFSSQPPIEEEPSDSLNRNNHRGISLPSPFGEGPGGEDYRTFTLTPAECDWNSGAYMHSMCVMPLLKSPDCVAKRVYSKTYLPFGIQSMKKWVAASLVDS